MSDTTQLVLWIVLGLVLVALIVWFFVSASRRRRVEDQQRAEAAALRSRVEERLPEIQNAEDRASVTTEIAQDARAEAEEKAAEAEEKAAEAARLERHAEDHRSEAEAAARERESLEREADRLDPDVRTDEGGYRVDRSGRRLDQPEGSQADVESQAERPAPDKTAPDKTAPAGTASENTGPDGTEPQESEPEEREPEEREPEERGAFGRPGGAPGSVAAGVSLAGSAVAAAAAGRAGGPQPFTDDDDEPDLADAENPFAGQEEPEPEPVPVVSAHEMSVEGEPENPAMESGSAEEADWVNGPVEDVADEELRARAAAETAAEDWINGPTEAEATSTADADATSTAAAGAGAGAAGVAAGGAVAGVAAAGTGAASTSDPREDEKMTSDDADWVNGPVEDVDQEEIDASAAEEAEAADWINGPADDEPSVIHAGARSEVAPADATSPEQVSVPALEETDDVLVGGGTPGDDPGDHRGQPWSTDLAADAGTRTASGTDAAQEPAAPAGPGEEPGEASHVAENPGPVEHSDAAPLLDDAAGTDEGDEGSSSAAAPKTEPVAARSQQPYGRDEPLDVEPIPEPSGSEVPPLDEPWAAQEPEAAEEPTATDEGPARERRISEYEEVRDGGYGVGSAAPLDDGAQPLGHAIKGYRESNTFAAPGDPGYDDAEPDVWFFNEEAARRAGFNPAGE